jgi:hypothetical protein
LAENPDLKVGIRGIVEGSKTNLAGADEKKAEHLQTILTSISPQYNGAISDIFWPFGTNNKAKEKSFNVAAAIHGAFVEDGKLQYYADAPKYTQLAMGGKAKSDKKMPNSLEANPVEDNKKIDLTKNP